MRFLEHELDVDGGLRVDEDECPLPGDDDVLEVRTVLPDLAYEVREVRQADDCPGTGVLEDEADLTALVHRVEGYGYRAELLYAEEAVGELRDVRQHDCHPITRADAERGKAASHAVRVLLELLIGGYLPLESDRLPLPVPAGDFLERVAEAHRRWSLFFRAFKHYLSRSTSRLSFASPRSSFRRILPVALLGSVSTNSTILGRL